ncbi:unnamed protein product, partial [Ectocarpus sp. 6 AP-2014]
VGTCTCSCGGENWRSFNIVGRASCVPRAAYETFGYVGLALALMHLAHAIYNLIQQRRSEAYWGGRGMVVKMLVDVYREQLSMISILHAPVIALFFALVLWLPDESVRWSAVALGASQSLSGIGAVRTVQVLIRSADPRLLKKGATVLKVSAALTHPMGRYTSFSAVSIGAVCLVWLMLMARTGQGYKVAAISYILVEGLPILVTVMCSRSMIRIIDHSIAQDAAKQRALGDQSTSSACSAGSGHNRTITVDPKLAGAKKTIISAMFFCITLTSIASTVLIFALTTEYGYDNPIVFLATPLAFGPLIALSFHVQLHSKRNKARRRGQQSPPQSNVNSFASSTSGDGRGRSGGRKITAASLMATLTGTSGRKTTAASVMATLPGTSGRKNVSNRVAPTDFSALEQEKGAQLARPAAPERRGKSVIADTVVK